MFELKAIVLLIELQIKITSGAIVSLAGVGLGKVEERQGEEEKNCHFLGNRQSGKNNVDGLVVKRRTIFS